MIFRSPYPDITIPEVPLTPLVLRRAHELESKPALIDGETGRIITYGQLAEAVRRVAIGLARRGLRKGDVFAIYSYNVPEFAIAFHAVSFLGGINTTINPLCTAEELTNQLNDARAKYLLTAPSLLGKALKAAAASGVEEVFVFGDAEDATPFAVLGQSDGQVPGAQINPREDVVALPYSSGTTGLPKGVMLTHYNLVANIVQMETVDCATGADTLICVLPLFHIYGMNVIMNMGLQAGATIVIMPRFEIEGFLRALQDYKVTFAHLVPPIVLALAKQPVVSSFDLSELRTIFSGAAPLGANVSLTCSRRLDCLIRQGYGMTETSPATHASPVDPSLVKPGSVGTCVPNTECKIVDTETGVELGANEEGEICVRGPQIMRGYLNRPEDTARTIDAGGWLHTGDIGYADADGHFYIVDRVKELIKYKAFQVAPAELEAVLLAHPCIADAAVVPSPDEEAGEVPKAFVVPKAGVTAEEIMGFVSERVAPHKRIRRVEIIEQIPKSASGKILRRVLVERERGRRQD